MRGTICDSSGFGVFEVSETGSEIELTVSVLAAQGFRSISELALQGFSGR